MSLLSGIDKLIASIAGPLAFEQGKLYRGGTYSVDPATGQTIFVPSTEYIKVLEADYSAFHRASLGIPAINRKLSILGYQTTVPVAGDRVSLRGIIWEIVSVARDPAGAVYSCEARPIGADVAGDPGATVNALTPLPGLVSDIAGPLLFGEAVLFRAQTSTLNAIGQAQRTEEPEAVLALEVNYSAAHRAQAGIPETDRGMLILGASMTAPPLSGDRLDINSVRYELINISRDPARAVYNCQARPIGVAVVLRYAAQRAILARSLLSATGEIKFGIHNGVLAAVNANATAVALVSVSHTGLIARVSAGVTVGAGVSVSHSANLARIGQLSAVAVDITGSHTGTLAPLSGQAVSSPAVAASLAVTLAPVQFAGAATAAPVLGGIIATHAGTTARAGLTGAGTVQISASAAGVLAPVSGTAQGGAETGATQAATLSPVSHTGQGETAVTGQSEGITGRSVLMAATDNLAVSVHAGTLGRVSGAGAATNATGAAQAATLARGVIGAAGETLASGAHAGALARAIFAGTASTSAVLDERTATHAGTLAGLESAATVQALSTATLASTLARIASTGTATLATSAAQSATIARLLSTSSATVLASAAHAGALARSTLGATATVDAGGGYDADAEALIARMTLTPESWHQDLINDCVVTLKSDGTWDRLTALYILNGQDKQASFLNWVADDSLSVVGSDITQLKPFFYMRSANVALSTQTNYLETGYGVDAKYTEADCHYGAISSTWRSNGNYPVMMIGGFLASYQHDASNSQVSGRINNGPAYGFGTLDHGHYAFSQTGGQLTPYLDGVAHSAPITQDAPAAEGTYSLLRTGSSTTELSNAAMRAFHMGQSLTSGQMATLNSALTTYMNGVTMGGPVNPAYMVPEMVGTPQTIPQSTSSLPLPAGIVAGDIILVMGARDASGMATPSGFTALRNASLASVQVTAAYKVAVGGETSVAVANATGQAWMSCVFRNVDEANPIDVTTTFLGNTTNLRTVWGPEITPVTDGCAIVVFGGLDDDVSTGVKHPDGYTPIASRQSGVSGTAVTIMAAYKIKNKASIECPLPFTAQGAADASHTISIALRPKAV